VSAFARISVTQPLKLFISFTHTYQNSECIKINKGRTSQKYFCISAELYFSMPVAAEKCENPAQAEQFLPETGRIQRSRSKNSQVV
jgi:hypothetical protein